VRSCYLGAMNVAASPFLPFGVFALSAALAALAAVWILNRALRAPAPEADPETRVYRDQLAELDRDLSDGRITQSGLEGARLEIGRRLAALAMRVQPATDEPAGKLAIAILAGAVALGTGAIYLATGNPNYGDQPFEERREALLARPATSLNDQELIALLQADAQKNKQDSRPHFFLGQVLASQGRDSDAIRAFQAALRRDPKSADALVGAGASLVRLVHFRPLMPWSQRRCSRASIWRWGNGKRETRKRPWMHGGQFGLNYPRTVRNSLSFPFGLRRRCQFSTVVRVLKT
jgi:cytochrome c-type biogenesis protein CcmH